jgi:hypothetical protein
VVLCARKPLIWPHAIARRFLPPWTAEDNGHNVVLILQGPSR